MTAETIVWISGATQGLGLGLARNVPYPAARVINLSRKQHSDYESVIFDLAKPESWAAVESHFQEILSHFNGKRAIFIHNANMMMKPGFTGETDPRDYRQEITANAVAPLVLGEMFLRCVRPGYESGLVMISSGSARSPVEGQSIYCAAKAAMEHWVRVVRRERKRRGSGTWVVAVRPGLVDTPAAHSVVGISPHDYPLAPFVAKQLASGEDLFDIDTAAKQIWAVLPPHEDKSVLLFGKQVTLD
jgi:benzil reductase ((S)-benzoin forming)